MPSVVLPVDELLRRMRLNTPRCDTCPYLLPGLYCTAHGQQRCMHDGCSSHPDNLKFIHSYWDKIHVKEGPDETGEHTDGV